jgi:uncharacterized protein (TIGR02421 family)
VRSPIIDTGSGISEGDLAIDAALADIAASFRFLLDLSPVDIPALREAFERDGDIPPFRYPPLEHDPAVLAERLAAVPVDEVEDPTVASLLLAKTRELRLQLEMLACRGSVDFLPLSVELFGAVSPSLLAEAEAILAEIPAPERNTGPWLDAEEIARTARAEIDRYRRGGPAFAASVEIREGSTGLMVSNGDLLIAPSARVSVARIAALLHHEIGVHIVTHVNGANQPLRVLADGLADHEETQEGLAVLAEHLAGGLTPGRLRLLAARVIAAHHLLAGAGFAEVHASLRAAGIRAGQAFTTTVRAFRSGGLTKDAVYLRGLRELLDHLGNGGDLDVLWLGKMPLTAVPLVTQLRDAGVLAEPVLRPRFLDDPEAQARLAALGQVRPLTALMGAPP